LPEGGGGGKSIFIDFEGGKKGEGEEFTGKCLGENDISIFGRREGKLLSKEKTGETGAHPAKKTTGQWSEK